MNRVTLPLNHAPQATDGSEAAEPTTMASGSPSLPNRHTGRRLWWLEWALLSCIPVLITVGLKPSLMRWWTGVMALWSTRMDLPIAHFAIGPHDSRIWATQAEGTFLPSSPTLTWTWLGLICLWAITHVFSDRWHPLKVITRALCLIQATACVFFTLSPARFPYTVTQHMHALLDMGYGLMLVTGPMLALGWGILTPSFASKIIAPLGVLAYFSLMLPHKVLLHAWLLTHGSVLFMPLLFLTFGMLFDLWIFIALYAWLASRLPRQAHALGGTS